MPQKAKITILISPLDWGLGHATRCIPLINYLLKKDCKVIIAADGIQKELLKSEFPTVAFAEIPGYKIKYTRAKRFFILKIAAQIPKILKAIYNERKWIRGFIKHNRVDAIISDNRYGLFNDKVTSVFITHQLLIKAPLKIIEKIMIKINYRFIKRFSQCWIPDEKGATNFAGALSHPPVLPPIQTQYLGGLSRLERQVHPNWKYKALIILSGPEPQRTLLEKILLNELKGFTENIMFVRGLPGSRDQLFCGNNVKVKNHISAKELETAMNESEFVVSRSGYTTVMDVFKLQKKSILIATPGQTEQEYLADHLQKQGWCVSAAQDNFNLKESLQKAELFTYSLPDLKMEHYKEIMDTFINDLTANKDR